MQILFRNGLCLHCISTSEFPGTSSGQNFTKITNSSELGVLFPQKLLEVQIQFQKALSNELHGNSASIFTGFVFRIFTGKENIENISNRNEVRMLGYSQNDWVCIITTLRISSTLIYHNLKC